MIGGGTQLRCECALKRARYWIAAKQKVTILCAPGRNEHMPAGVTMASHMQEFMATYEEPVEYVVNDYDEEVFGTIKELEWIFHQLDLMGAGDMPIELVTNRRHAVRVSLICRIYHPDRSVEFVYSDDYTSLGHEVRGYMKIAVPKRFLPYVERLRRKYYRE